MRCLAACLWAFFCCLTCVAAQTKSAESGESDPRLNLAEIKWGFHAALDPDPKLPRVLLIGDSIVGGYRKAVAEKLAGKANIDAWVTGMNEGSPELHENLKKALAHGPYAVVHFNIGLHGWQKGRIPEGQYEPLMRKYLGTLRTAAPHARLIWASTTPVTAKGSPERLDPEINPIIVARNEIAARLMKEKENGLEVDDLYGLMVDKLSTGKGKNKNDQFHWSAAGIELQAAAVAAIVAKNLPSAEAPLDMTKRAEVLKRLHWGMFICWSFSTFSGKEWTRGVKDIATFKATEVDADQWARTAKEAGMGYILFLTKHHDGFCLWDTKTTERKVTNAPLKRDVLAELRKSCDKYGIKLALYFSEGEFKDNADYHPGGYTPEMKKAQLKELLTQYGPIEYIWFDHAQTDGGLSHKETVAWCKQFQPGCFIGFNHGDQEGADIRLGEMGRPGPLSDKSSAGPHMRNAPSKSYLLAEFTYPILPGHKGGAMWFYSLPKHDQLCRPAEKLYSDYLGAVKYGNIFSLDVGPDYRGKLRDIDVATLRKVGEMIRNPPAVDPASH